MKKVVKTKDYKFLTETVANIEDAIKAYIEVMMEVGEREP